MKRCGPNDRGSILIVVIITIIAMGILGTAMMSMFSTSTVGTITPSLTNNAYYNAESAYRYVLYSFLKADENNRFQELKTAVHGKTLVMDGSNQATITIEAFWFIADGNQSATTTLNVKTPISFPEEYVGYDNTLNLPSTGYLSIEGDLNNPVQYTGVNYNSGTGVITFTLATSRSINDGTEVFPAFTNTSLTSTISEGDTISVGSGGGSLEAFPRKNGVFNLTTRDGGIYVLLYEKVSADNTRLINVKSASNFAAIPSGGLRNYGGISQIALQQNTRIRSAGLSGDTAGSFSARRTLDYYQPMVEGTIVTKHTYEDNFSNLDNWRTGSGNEVGSHGVVNVNDSGIEAQDGDSAMVVTSTESVDGPVSMINAAYFGKGVQESLLEYKPDVAGFQDIWEKSDKKLSYELQCKIAFTEDTDHADNNPMGTYMPGIVFRARESETYPDIREYYGLSFMRALFAKDGNGDPAVTDPDADDIPDQYLFEDNPVNDAIPNSVTDDVCIADYTPGSTWNDTPPKSGVPYMIFWQKALDFERWDGFWERNSTLYVDWLSYVPLCKITTVTVYYYPQMTGGGDSVPCADCASCTPVTWRAYRYGNGNTGFYWLPDDPECCLEKNEVGNGWANTGQGFRRFIDYECTSYDCTGDCYDASCCGTGVVYPEGWYEGPIPGDPRTPTTYSALKLEIHSEFGDILQHELVTVSGNEDAFSLIGRIDNDLYVVRDPATVDLDSEYRGDPVEDAAFVFPEQPVDFQQQHNYRVYLKPWVTVMARIIEMKGDYYDEDGSGCGNSEEERINVIQAWFGEPASYPRGEIRWPDTSSASFSEMIWPDTAYTSKMDDFTTGTGLWAAQRSRRLCERGDDEYTGTTDKRSPYVYSNQLTSDQYDGYSEDNQPAEVGLHTFGIDASDEDDDHKDKVYFDDFAVRVFEYGTATGLLQGVQSE